MSQPGKQIKECYASRAKGMKPEKARKDCICISKGTKRSLR
jgi:hypothetical protein